MYRLALYYFIALIGIAMILALLHIILLNPFSLLISTLFLVAVCWVTNTIFSKIFEAPTNAESVYISALILVLIIDPPRTVADVWLLFWAAALTIASKYIFAIGKKHIFNPVAAAVLLTSFSFGGAASWWVGTAWMFPFVVVGGLLIIRKLQREELVAMYFVSALVVISSLALIAGKNILLTLEVAFLSSPLFFLGFAMLTEPMTMPPTRNLQLAYGVMVGFLSVPQLYVAGIYSTPELALCLGNIFAYVVSPKYKLMLKLKEKINYGKDIIDFNFFLTNRLIFIPGQYMEWTLPHDKTDSRGNRRFLTIASSPTEDMLRLGVKFYPNGSSFKKAMWNMDDKSTLVGGQLAGDFTLPVDPYKKCVLLAGGIGITPFRSMIKYLIDTKERRPITLFYSNKIIEEISYFDVFEEARKQLGIKTIYTLTDKEQVPMGWQGNVGRLDATMIQQEISDYQEQTYYLSGPHAMVNGFEKTLLEMGIKKNKIIKDFFPGFA